MTKTPKRRKYKSRKPQADPFVPKLSRQEFREQAMPLTVKLDAANHNDVLSKPAMPREFSTGGLGWSLTNRTYLKVGEKFVLCQVSLNIMVVGGKHVE